jgi:hypothetical protein
MIQESVDPIMDDESSTVTDIDDLTKNPLGNLVIPKIDQSL